MTIGRSRAGTQAPLFLDQTEARMTPLSQGLDDCPTPPPYLRVWMTAPPPLSEGLYLPLVTALIFWNSCISAQERSILP